MTVQVIKSADTQNPGHLPVLRTPETAPVPTWFSPHLIKSSCDVLSRFYAHRSPSTLRSYKASLEYFTAWIGAPSVSECVDFICGLDSGALNGTVDTFKEHLMSLGKSASFTNGKLAAIRSVLKSARMIGATSVHIEIQSVPVKRGTVIGPSAETVIRVLNDLKGQKSKAAIRDRVIILLLFNIGLRRAELASLDAKDVDIHGLTLTVRRKGQHDKSTVPIKKEVRDAIRRWKVYRDGSTPALLTSFDTSGKSDPRLTGSGLNVIVKKRFAAVGIKCACHQLRHSAATCAFERGAGIAELMNFMGHKSIATTQIYIDRLADSQGKVAELLNDLIAGGIQ